EAFDKELEAPMEDQPLPTNASPTALLPGYINDSNPEEDEEDPEEDPVDYPANGRDNDDNESSDDDNDDDVEKDREDDEEVEHLALVDLSVVPIDDHVKENASNKRKWEVTTMEARANKTKGIRRVRASKPKTMQDAIEIATKLMNKKISTLVECQTKDKKRLDNTSKNNQNQQPPNNRQNTGRAYTARHGEKKHYNGSKPLFSKCYYHHDGPCTEASQKATCYECGNQGHYRRVCKINAECYRARYRKEGDGMQHFEDWIREIWVKNVVLCEGMEDKNLVYKEEGVTVRGYCSQPLGVTVLDHLMPVELGSFDPIIGMDWLRRHHAMIVCDEKLISATRKDDKSEGKQVKDVPIIQDFPKVFSENLPGLPPTRPVKFQIDLILRAAPVAQGPYRLAPSRIKELSKKLQELSDKGIIQNGKVAYKLKLPKELSRVHHTFHVSNVKKCYSDESLVMPLEGVHINGTLQFVGEPVEIMEREIKQLKRSRIPLVKCMRIRNLYFPNNSSVTIPRRRNKRRTPNVVEPELRTIVEIAPMVDNRTMEELLQAPTKAYGEAIVIPKINADHSEIKINLLQLVQAHPYHGFERENPHTHINNLKRITSTFKFRDVPNDVIKFMIFPYSLEGAVRVWYDKEPSNSILTLEDLVNKFVNQFFPPSKTTPSRMKSLDLLKDSRRHLERHKNDLRKCLELNVSRMNKTSRENASMTYDRIDKLADQISTLVDIFSKKIVTPATVKAVEESCVTCGGNHAYYNCDATNINQSSFYATTSTYNQVAPQNRATNFMAPPGFAPVQNNSQNSNKMLFKISLKDMLSGFFQNQTSTSGTLPSNTIPNPNGKMKAITTRSGIAYEGPSIPTKPSPKKVVERETEEKTDKEQTNFQGSTAHIQPSVVPIPEPDVLKILPKPNIPYPSRLNDQKLPLAYLGASINLMPLSIWKKLSLPELTPTRMTLELADRSITRPKGVAEDVFVKVGKFHFPIDFVVVDFKADPRVPLILGRSFLRTSRALIVVYGEEITLRVNDEAVTFNVNQTTRYPSTYDDMSWVEAKALPTNDARVVVKFLKSLFARFGTPRAIISNRGIYFCNDKFAKVMSKYGVTHRLATTYHPQKSGQVEVSNHGLKRILERTFGENRASWSEKLKDTLWAFRTAYKIPIGCTPYKLVYGKSCQLPIELEHKAYWALKHVNFDLKPTGDYQKLQLNELKELHDQAYENSLIYKEKTKKLCDSKIKNRIFNVGDQVLHFNSRLKIFSGKLKTHWLGPFTITKDFSYGTIELSQPEGPNFKVNGHRVKHYFGVDIPQLVVSDLQTFPMDK
nr:reverse transcriptase domain-containing protein [Tanacetum cinerariifolium]